MSLESFLSEKLRKFSIVDFSLVKSVYFVIGLLVFSLYSDLANLSAWFYFFIMIFCAMPLWVHQFSQPGNLLEKMHRYIQTNNPSNQVLLFLTMFFFALMLAIIIPFLASGPWWLYVVIIIALAIKPLQKTWFW